MNTSIFVFIFYRLNSLNSRCYLLSVSTPFLTGKLLQKLFKGPDFFFILFKECVFGIFVDSGFILNGFCS